MTLTTNAAGWTMKCIYMDYADDLVGELNHEHVQQEVEINDGKDHGRFSFINRYEESTYFKVLKNGHIFIVRSDDRDGHRYQLTVYGPVEPAAVSTVAAATTIEDFIAIWNEIEHRHLTQVDVEYTAPAHWEEP